MRIVHLAPERPEAADAPLYDEVEALRAWGLDAAAVTALGSTRAPGALAPPGHGALRASGLRVLSRLPAALIAHPLRAADALVILLRDLLAGEHRGEGRWRGLGHGLAGLALGRALSRGGATHLLVRGAGGAATIGMFAARYARVPLALAVGAPDLRTASLLREKLRRAKRVTALTERAAKLLAEEWGMRGVEVVRAGVDLERLAPRPAQPPTETPLLFAPGPLEPESGLDVLLEAVSRVRAGQPSLRVCIAGRGARAEVGAVIARRNLGGTVELVGELAPDDALELLASASALVITQRAEAPGADDVPPLVVEALAGGVPVVCTNVGALPEVVQAGRSGILLPPGDADALSEALANLLRDDVERTFLAQGARRAVEKDWDLYATTRRRVEPLLGLSLETPAEPTARAA